MQRKTLLTSALALLIAATAVLATAQSAAPNAPTPPSAGPAGKGSQPDHEAHGFRGGPGFGGPGPGFGSGFMGPRSPVIADLRDLERLYMASGRNKELPTLYNDVLSKSQDPQVRTYVYRQLARIQSEPTNPDQAIATLRMSLDENLANEAKQRAELEKMRSDWEQRRGPMKPASAPAAQP